jgi:arylsulfatase
MGIEPTDAEIAHDIDRHGGPSAYGNYPAAWAWATNAPFQWGKQVASHLGGLRDGLVISWPKRIRADGRIRSQFHHVVDIAPTIYEAAGITPPASIDGSAQQSIDGVSMVYTFDHADAPTTHREQYFEMLGNRSYYKDGWMASTTPRVLPFDRSNTAVDPLTFAWELYDLRHDYSQAHDVSAQYPAKLAELKSDFDAAARKYHVYPLASNIMGRLGAANRPNPIEGRTHFTYEAGDTRYSPNSFPALAAGWSMIAHLEVTSANAHGPLVVQGDVYGGAGLTLEEGRPTFLYNPSGRSAERVVLASPAPLAPGKHDIQVSTGPNAAAGPRAAHLTLTIDGKAVASAEVPVLYAVHGDAYIGRKGLGSLLPDQVVGSLAGATVQSVDIDTMTR